MHMAITHPTRPVMLPAAGPDRVTATVEGLAEYEATARLVADQINAASAAIRRAVCVDVVIEHGDSKAYRALADAVAAEQLERVRAPVRVALADLTQACAHWTGRERTMDLRANTTSALRQAGRAVRCALECDQLMAELDRDIVATLGARDVACDELVVAVRVEGPCALHIGQEVGQFTLIDRRPNADGADLTFQKSRPLA